MSAPLATAPTIPVDDALLRWLLDLDSIPADAQDIRIAWEQPLPGWAWAIALVLVASFCIYSYSKLRGRPAGRVALALVRGALLMLLVALLCGPMLVQPREQIERDWVLMLVDRSASLEIADGESAGGGEHAQTNTGRRTRDWQVRHTLRGASPLFRELSERRTLVWLGFDGAAFDLAPGAAAGADAEDRGLPVLLGPADGWRTRLGTAIEQALQRAAARPLAGVVIFSDGRTSEPPSRALVRRLVSQATPVYVVPLGSDAPLGDVAVRRVESPQRAFVRDVVPVVVEIDRLGEAGVQMPATARLIDQRTGAELDRVEIPTGEASSVVTLTGRSEEAGDAIWSVVVETTRDDLVPENNRRDFGVGLVDRPLRVLYVEGYPRWEYRYLKDLLVREKSVESSVMLLSADRDFAQEGNLPIARLPRTMEEFAPFDLVIVGDLPASFFTPEQLVIIRESVASRGMGLLWIGGAQSTPSGWSGTALADLLPMRPPLDLPAIGVPVNMVAGPLAERLGVLQLRTHAARQLGEEARPAESDGWPRELTDQSVGWSRLQWAQRIEPQQLKPTAEVLAETVQHVSGDPMPLVITMRYGAGHVLYVATDEVWRWRYGRGETLPEQFWVQLIRMLGRERIAGVDQPLQLDAQPRRVAPGQPVRLTLTITDAALAALEPADVAATILRTEDDGREGDGNLVDAARDGEMLAEVSLRPTGREGEYAATWMPEEVGLRTVVIRDPALPEAATARATFEVVRPDEERRQPETDHALLRTLAEETGGRVLPLDDLSALRTLPNRAIRTDDDITERIWNTPLALILVLLLAAAEWIGRRAMSLL